MAIYKTNYGLNVSVDIQRNNETNIAEVYVLAPIYMNYMWKMPHCYNSKDYSDNQILKDNDFHRVLFNAYGAN